MKQKKTKKINPPQSQSKQPGLQSEMHPKPISVRHTYHPSGKLKDRVAIITGGDSGIGRAVAYHFALEGAKIVFVYLDEDKDAQVVQTQLKELSCDFIAIKGDIGNPKLSKKIVAKTIDRFGRIDCIVNNAAEQHEKNSVTEISHKQLLKTFTTNVFAYFYLTQEALPHLKKGATIINTTSVTAYRGSEHLIDYSSTKGAIVSFTRSLSQSLVKKGIRVNGVAPGPVWTPLIPASFDKKHVAEFGAQSPMGEPAQPADIAPAYVYLASDDSLFMSGQILHPNGGEIING